MKLSIIIPAHNEEARIGPMLDAYLPYFSRTYGDNVEILTVVNGSSDRTKDVVGTRAKQCPNLRCVVEPRRIGKGGALMLGFSLVGGEFVGFTDADGSTPPDAFDELVKNIGNAGAIIASRWRRGARVSPKQPVKRRIASRILNLLTRTLFGLRLTDTQCGAKLMRREALTKVLPEIGITRWAFDIDLLFKLKRAGFEIREIPTSWHDVAGSKIELTRASFEMLAALIRLRLLYSPFRWTLKVYDRTLGRIINLEEYERAKQRKGEARNGTRNRACPVE